MQAEQCITLSGHQQRRVWEGWLSAEIRGCYFAQLVSYYQSRQRWLTLLTLVASSGASIAIVGHWPTEWPKLVLALATTGISLAGFVLRDNEQALKCSDLHFDWNRLANEYEAIWENMYTEDADEKLLNASNRALELSKSGASIPDQDSRLLKCQEYVESLHASK